jgi:REP element-mobilizing transposase RayT
MDKYKNKYRIASARAPFWDYGCNAAYFVTICTHNREHYFGEIINGKMQLSEIGEIGENEWLKTFEMRPDMNLWMGDYVVMPNHFHAIIGIGQNQYNTQRDTQRDTQRRDAMHCVSTTNTTNTTNTANTTNTTHTNTTATTNNDLPLPSKNQFGPQSKNLASIIRGFKIGVTKNARILNPDFKWQPRYHDSIIRDDQSLQRISKYIINNPKNWNGDKFWNK